MCILQKLRFLEVAIRCSKCGAEAVTTGDPYSWIRASDHIFCGTCGAHVGEVDNSWVSVEKELPPENIAVDTKVDDGYGVRNETQLVRRNHLWFFPDFSMYVYYAPTHWRYRKNYNFF